MPIKPIIFGTAYVLVSGTKMLMDQIVISTVVEVAKAKLGLPPK